MDNSMSNHLRNQPETARLAFSQHPQPTFAKYLQWATDVAGCLVYPRYRHTRDGNMETITRIEAPSGRSVTEIGLEQNDRLPPTTIGRLDRRLGLKSPF